MAADPAALKARVEVYVRNLQADRATAAATYAGELARIDAQIAAAQQVLQAWDGRVDTLIGLLGAAGIQVQV